MCRGIGSDPELSIDFFDKLQGSDEANGSCFDCGTEGAEWASVSHGIYISIGASGVHRSLGVATSRVLSLRMDAWKPIHRRLMELGGNHRFREFLRAQGVPEDLPIREKYGTKAADWYRRNLHAEAEGSEPPAPLAPGEGPQPLRASDEQRELDEIFANAPMLTTAGLILGGGDKKRGPAENGWLCRVLCVGFRDVLGAPRNVGLGKSGGGIFSSEAGQLGHPGGVAAASEARSELSASESLDATRAGSGTRGAATLPGRLAAAGA